jgi:hypothetical protein
VERRVQHRAGPAEPGSDLSPDRRACGVAVHLATEVLGDPTDRKPARIRVFVDRALPQVRPQVSAQLLIQLADLVELEVDLRAWGRDQALCRAVAAVHSTARRSGRFESCQGTHPRPAADGALLSDDVGSSVERMAKHHPLCEAE